MTSLPEWAVWTVSFGTPAAAFAAVLVGNLITRIGSRELEARSRREERGRNLRWAAELAIADNPDTSFLGVTVLQGLLAGALPEEEREMITSALNAVVSEPIEEYDRSPDVIEPDGSDDG